MYTIQVHLIPLPVQECSENVPTQQIERQTLPEFLPPHSFVHDVKYHCELDDQLFTEENNFKTHKAKCS
jgi:hypothetical protein